MPRANPCHAEFILRNMIKIYLYFVSFFSTKMVQVFKILPLRRQRHIQYWGCWCPGDARIHQFEFFIFKWEMKKMIENCFILDSASVIEMVNMLYFQRRRPWRVVRRCRREIPGKSWQEWQRLRLCEYLSSTHSVRAKLTGPQTLLP